MTPSPDKDFQTFSACADGTQNTDILFTIGNKHNDKIHHQHCRKDEQCDACIEGSPW